MFYQYYKDINKDDEDIHRPDDPEFDAINKDEILKTIRSLKNGKASCLYSISNEYIKSSCDVLLPVYYKLFNKILDSGILPNSSFIGKIVPIFKNKGDKPIKTITDP